MRTILVLMFISFSILKSSGTAGQQVFAWTTLPPLPDQEGFAGMFAGVSDAQLFCMGGANFPGKRPWQGGVKKWYSRIYRLDNTGTWTILVDTLPAPLAYGVSITYQNSIYIIGGNTDNVHTNKVYSYRWDGTKLLREECPPLPIPLANMAGSLVKSLVIVAGGSTSPTNKPIKKVFALDLNSIKKGWFEMPAWPGPERSYPTCAVIENTFYLLSGERIGTNHKGEKFRYILQDAYSFTVKRENGKWTGKWKAIAPLPKGAAAAGNPSPVLGDGRILISGGVDALTALHTDQPTHPGINTNLQVYNPADDSWQLIINRDTSGARVTLPTVNWNKLWVFVSGEVKPGIRTNTVVSVN